MSEYVAREYQTSDLPEITEWWWTHTGENVPVSLLPPLGVVVTRDAVPVAALWVFMAAGIGVCFAEFPVSRPGLSLKEIKGAFGVALGALEAAVKANDYGVMICHTLPPIARVMRGFGFESESRNKTTVMKLL